MSPQVGNENRFINGPAGLESSSRAGAHPTTGGKSIESLAAQGLLVVDGEEFGEEGPIAFGTVASEDEDSLFGDDPSDDCAIDDSDGSDSGAETEDEEAGSSSDDEADNTPTSVIQSHPSTSGKGAWISSQQRPTTGGKGIAAPTETHQTAGGKRLPSSTASTTAGTGGKHLPSTTASATATPATGGKRLPASTTSTTTDTGGFTGDNIQAFMSKYPSQVAKYLKENPRFLYAYFNQYTEVLEKILDDEPKFLENFLVKEPGALHIFLHSKPQMLFDFFEKNPAWLRNHPGLVSGFFDTHPNFLGEYLKARQATVQKYLEENPALFYNHVSLHSGCASAGQTPFGRSFTMSLCFDVPEEQQHLIIAPITWTLPKDPQRRKQKLAEMAIRGEREVAVRGCAGGNEFIDRECFVEEMDLEQVMEEDRRWLNGDKHAEVPAALQWCTGENITVKDTSSKQVPPVGKYQKSFGSVFNEIQPSLRDAHKSKAAQPQQRDFAQNNAHYSINSSLAFDLGSQQLTLDPEDSEAEAGTYDLRNANMFGVFPSDDEDEGYKSYAPKQSKDICDGDYQDVSDQEDYFERDASHDAGDCDVVDTIKVASPLRRGAGKSLPGQSWSNTAGKRLPENVKQAEDDDEQDIVKPGRRDFESDKSFRGGAQESVSSNSGTSSSEFAGKRLPRKTCKQPIQNNKTYQGPVTPRQFQNQQSFAAKSYSSKKTPSKTYSITASNSVAQDADFGVDEEPLPPRAAVPYPAPEHLLQESRRLPEGTKWRLFEEDLVIDYMLEVHEDGVVKGEERFRTVGNMLRDRNNINRTWTGIKNFWNRTGRARSGFDERRTKGGPLATSRQGKDAKALRDAANDSVTTPSRRINQSSQFSGSHKSVKTPTSVKKDMPIPKTSPTGSSNSSASQKSSSAREMEKMKIEMRVMAAKFDLLQRSMIQNVSTDKSQSSQSSASPSDRSSGSHKRKHTSIRADDDDDDDDDDEDLEEGEIRDSHKKRKLVRGREPGTAQRRHISAYEGRGRVINDESPDRRYNSLSELNRSYRIPLKDSTARAAAFGLRDHRANRH